MGTKFALNPATGNLDVIQDSDSPTGFVPYVGAEGDVNLGVHNLLLQGDIFEYGNIKLAKGRKIFLDA